MTITFFSKLNYFSFSQPFFLRSFFKTTQQLSNSFLIFIEIFFKLTSLFWNYLP